MMRFFIFLLVFVSSAFAGVIETVTVTITNAPTTNGMTFVLGASTRTWTNVVSIPGSQIQTNSTIGGVATNFYAHVTGAPFSGLVNAIAWSSTNIITFSGLQGVTFTSSQSGNWASIAITTNTLTDTIAVHVPAETSALTNRQYTFSKVVDAIDKYATNVWTGTNVALSDYVNVDQTQTVTGAKTFNGNVDLHGSANTLSGSIDFLGGSTTVFDSGSFLQFANNALIVGNRGIFDGMSFWNFNQTNANYQTIPHAIDLTNYWTAVKLQTNSFVQITNSFVTGSTVSNSTLSGYVGALTNGTLTGTALSNVTASGYIGALTNGILVNAGATNLTLTNSTSTYNFDVGGDIAWKFYNIASMAPSNNAGVNLGTNVYVRISNLTGGGGPFGLNGVINGRNGKWYKIENGTIYTLTLYNESGVDPVPANRILTQTGANVNIPPGGFFELIYDANSSRWKLASTWGAQPVFPIAFQTKADMRAFQGYPLAVSTVTTTIAFLLGGVTLGDGNGGNYYYSVTTTNLDNDVSCIIPGGIIRPTSGGWLKY